MLSLLYRLALSCVVLLPTNYVINAQNNSEKISESSCQNILAFMEEEIEFTRYVFHTGDFPTFNWKNEISVENEIGKFPLTVKYFNRNFEQVIRADNPGRYGAVIEGTTPAGFIIKRYFTLFCTNIEFDDYSFNVPIKMNPLPDYGIENEKWEKYSKNEEHFSFGSFKFFPMYSKDAAIFLAGLNDMEELNNNFDTPRIRDRQWWITMKKILDGNTTLTNPLKKPKKIKTESYVELDNSVVFSEDYSKEKIDNLRMVCRRWAKEGGAAHVVLIVHKGKIIFREAFSDDEIGDPVTFDSKMWMASITKLLTGVLMMQFVDQGIVDLDMPVAEYLSEIKGVNSDKLTVCNLFNHTSGLEFVGEWGSDWNYSLENQIAQILPSITVGKIFSYNRVGYALAGKIIERLTGRAVPYLFQDYIFSPLEMKTAYSDNTYGGLYCTATELAHLGLMLLNRGKYNGFEFFSEKTFTEMLPQKLKVNDRSWGIGTSPKGGHGLSDLAYGHGAGSGTIFCIDPKNDLIIISARNTPGKKYDKFENDFIESCTAIVKGH